MLQNIPGVGRSASVVLWTSVRVLRGKEPGGEETKN